MKSADNGKAGEPASSSVSEPAFWNQDDLAATGFDPDRDLSYPGQYPYTRGIQPTMYRGRLWTMRQIAGFGTGEDTNVRFRYLIAQGQTGLSVDFDMPTLMGYDSDDPLSEGEVGREGVAIDTLDDMEALFKDIDLTKISVSMTINPTAWILLGMYVALAESRGDDLNQLSGTVQADILKEYQAQKEWIYPIRPSMRIVRDLIVYCSRNLKRYNPINISGYHISEAGANAVQELAFTMCNANCTTSDTTSCSQTHTDSCSKECDTITTKSSHEVCTSECTDNCTADAVSKHHFDGDMDKCHQNCSHDCDSRCDTCSTTDQATDCTTKCMSVVQNECTEEVNRDCVLSCQTDNYTSCQTDTVNTCNTTCQNKGGGLSTMGWLEIGFFALLPFLAVAALLFGTDYQRKPRAPSRPRRKRSLVITPVSRKF